MCEKEVAIKIVAFQLLKDFCEILPKKDGIAVFKFEFSFKKTFEKESIDWYRKLFYERNRGHKESISNLHFLMQWGYILQIDGQPQPTRAAILLFGSQMAIHHMLFRPVLEVQWIPGKLIDPLPETRWLDRIVFEQNLISTWRKLVDRYVEKSDKPFRIDPHTLLREDTPLEYKVFREAAMNLLMHQDYGDHSRKAVIKFYRDGIQFWNPGDVFGEAKNLFVPGEKDIRNPRIATAFRKLGLCEQAGTGMRMVVNEWQKFGHPQPEYKDDRANKSFEIFLPLKPIEEILSVSRIKPPAKANQQVGEQVDLKILIYCETAKTKAQILKYLDMSIAYMNYKRHILPLVENKLLEMTVPDKPSSRFQKYRTTMKGKNLIATNKDTLGEV